MVQEEIEKASKTDERFPNVETYIQHFAGTKAHVIEKVLIVASNDFTAIQFMRSVRQWSLEVFGNEKMIQFVVMMSAQDNSSTNQEFIRMADHMVHIEADDSKSDNPILDLDLHRILEIAREYNVHAVWCGREYAIHKLIRLSEAVESSADPPPMKYIGPGASVMKLLLEDEIQCSLVAQTIGLPCLSWNGEGTCNVTFDKESGFVSMDSYESSARIGSLEDAMNAAQKIGFPVRIMACNTKGYTRSIRRIVSKVEDVEDAYRQVCEEVPGGNVLIRTELSNVRHVVVAVLADEYGNVVALNGRDCSVRSNHEETMVEEGPATIVPTHVWEQMETCAVLLAKEVGFASAGTVEFLYSESDQKFYFLKVTPSPTIGDYVTEMITKVNIPVCQLQVAMGIELGNISNIRKVYDITLNDTSLNECTNAMDFNAMKPTFSNGYNIAIYLKEDNNEKQASSGADNLTELKFDSTQNVLGYISTKSSHAHGDTTNLELIHLFATGNDREEARHNAIIALKELSGRENVMAKVKYMSKVMELDDYIHNRIDTKWLDRCDIEVNNECAEELAVEKKAPSIQDASLSNHVKVVIGALITAFDKCIVNEENHRNNHLAADGKNKSQTVMEHTVELILDKTKYKLCCKRVEPNRFSVSVSGSPGKHLIANIRKDAEESYMIDVGGKSRCASVSSRANDSSGLNLVIDGIDVSFSLEFETIIIKSKFSGNIMNILAENGSRLNQGDIICEIDAMNESKPLTATKPGVITWKISKGDTVKEGDIVAAIKSDCPQEAAGTTGNLFHGDLDIDGWCVDTQHNNPASPYFTFKNPFESFNSGLSGYGLMSQTTFNTAFDDLKKVVAQPILPEPDYDTTEPSPVSSARPDVKVKESSNPPSPPHKDAGVNDMKKKANRSTAVNHDKCLAQLRQLEKEFNAQISEKDALISEIKEANDDLRKQVDQLTLESDGLNKTIQAGKERLSEVDKKDEEIHNLKELLSDAQTELATTNESYSTLKSRVKSVATELKERRTECRSLSARVEELTLVKSTLEAEINDYQIRLSKLEILMDDKNREIESLNCNVAELRSQLKEKEKELAEKASISERALDSYKKKAQSSLAHANARVAAANQAKEEAEIAATNAMNVSTTALNKAQEAEERRNVIIAKAEQDKNHFLGQLNEYRSLYEDVKEELSQARENLKLAEEERSQACKSRDELLEELSSNQQEVEQQTSKCLNLEQEIQLQRFKTQELEEEIRCLREELDNYASAAFKARQAENATPTESNDNIPTNSVIFSPSGTDGAIAILQQELQIANDVIKELKEALGAILSQNPSTIEPKQIIQDLKMDGSPQRKSHLHATNLSQDETVEPTPLFFAFEKQAELNTARDEITRLAAILGDAESSKVEAFEAMNEMRKKMEEAEARLRRYEKLAPTTNSRSGAPHSTSSVNNSFANRRVNGSSSLSASASTRQRGLAGASQPQNDSTVNLEYLKNIILRFMKATSLNEKRALVPVISAVLELTADEQESALQNLEKSSNVAGVGVSLIENIQNKGFHGLFS